jgi:iron complex outermembrane receptor protein
LKLILSLFLLNILLYSQEQSLDNLLKEYTSSKELYLETKKESAGHLIIFSRSDLDKMQAYTLNDVLKTLRMFTLQTRKNGMTTLTKAGDSQLSSHPAKIYINSHELNSATLGNVLVQYGKMGLYFIDHIEVYQAGSSVTFGNEPGSMLIKLYTKEPSRENGTSTQVSLDSLGGSTLQAVDAGVFDDYSYLANVDLKKDNFKSYRTNNSELSKDGKRGQFYFKFSKDESYDIEVGAAEAIYDIFSGLGTAATDGYTHTKDIYVQATKYFDNDVIIKLSSSYESLKLYNQDSIGILLPDATTTNSLNTTIGTKVNSATLDKRFINGSNDLLIGAQFKHQKFKIDEYKSNGVDKPMTWGPTDLSIYMAYLENLYNINENHLITLSAKIDHYDNDLSKSSTEHILRAGYVALIDESWKFKLFAVKSYVYPTFLQTTYSPNYNINPDLQSSKSVTYSAEIIYNTDKATLSFGGGTSEVDDEIVFNMSQNRYVNSTQKDSCDILHANAEYRFDIDNKLRIEYFKSFQKNYYSPKDGGFIQFFNTVGNFDFYNELIYRSAYTSIDNVKMSAGYDYSLGAIYKINRRTEVKLKGENLLGRASEVPLSGIKVPAIDRRVLLTMEYTF